jgi:hypothetical protein
VLSGSLDSQVLKLRREAMASTSYRSWADRIVVSPIDTKETEVESVSTSAPSPQSLVEGGGGGGTTEAASFALEGERDAHAVPEVTSSASEEEEERVFLAPVDATSSDELAAVITPAATTESSFSYEGGPEIIDLTTISDVVSTNENDDRMNSHTVEGRSSRAPAASEVEEVPWTSSEANSLASSPHHPIVVDDVVESERSPAGLDSPPLLDEPVAEAPVVIELVDDRDRSEKQSGSVVVGRIEEVDVPEEDGDNLMTKENRNDVTATTSMDVTGMTVNDEDDDDDDDDELKYSDSLRTDEHEIAFGAMNLSDRYESNEAHGGDDDVDDDELNLDALLARTVDDDDDDDHVNHGGGDVDSAAEDDDHATQEHGADSHEDEMDDLLNELLDDTHNAAEELDDLLNEQHDLVATTSPPAVDAVPHVGDVDEAKAVSQPSAEAHADAETVVAPPTSRAATPVSVGSSSKPSAVRHVQPLANRAKDEGASSTHKDTMPDAKVTRPNLSARIPGTRRYVAPSSKAKKNTKPSLTVEIPEPADGNLNKTPTRATSPSQRRWSPKSGSDSTPPRNVSGAATVFSEASSSPAKKKTSMIKAFTRALSSGQSKRMKSPPGELSPRAQGVLPTLKPIDPSSRLLKETSASVAQKRNRFIPPPLSFPTIGEVMRAIHSGAFDRKASSSSASASSPRSPRWGGSGAASSSKAGTDCGGSTASSRSRPRKKSAL